MIGTITEIISHIKDFDNEKKYEIQEYHEKRSKSQNSYMWEIINKIANALRLDKEEVYLNMLMSYGQSEIISMKSIINPQGYFKYYKEIGKSAINDVEFTHYKIYKGSSEYNSLEMSILIDGVIREAEQLNIPTMTPEEIKRLRLWT